ncbi:Abhydrolase_3 domain-containing protein, partial [Cephalotus follicularis]
WLRNYGEFTRFCLVGRGRGGNIVFRATVSVLDLDINPLKICGLALNQPMFGGLQRTTSELKFATDTVLPLPALDLLWDLALPTGTNHDHPYCNPMVGGPHLSKVSMLRRCLMIGFGEDPTV